MRKIQILVKGGELDFIAAVRLRMAREIKILPKVTVFGSTSGELLVPEEKLVNAHRILAQWFCENLSSPDGFGFPPWTLLHYSDAQDGPIGAIDSRRSDNELVYLEKLDPQ